MTSARWLAIVNLLLATFLLVQCTAFNVVQKSVRSPTKVTIQSPVSNLFSNPRSTRPRILMTDDSKEQEETEAKSDEMAAKSSNDVDEKRGVMKTIILTVPLFCKFVIVLLIKFVTDLIVFPLLFLYRLAGIAKRRFYKMIGKGPEITEKPNGET